MSKSSKRIFYFGHKRVDGRGTMRELLGGKGANLAEMTRLGLPVPPGFTICTRTCLEVLENNGAIPAGLHDELDKNIQRLQKDCGRMFGDEKNPLLVSVRSGAANSMPGMMDTILNLGLNDRSVEGLARLSKDRRFALDAYRRLIQMYGDVVMSVDHHHFEQALDGIKKQQQVENDAELNEAALEQLIQQYKIIFKQHTKQDFPQRPQEQLEMSIASVFNSWNTPRARRYREIHAISDQLGTAVNIQSMVFGNLGETSASGVAFTRNPADGSNQLYGEFLINAQGEDVVAGIRTPQTMRALSDWNRDIYKQLKSIKKILEAHYHDMQDIEFTIEQGRLYMLQTRTGKRSGHAALKIAVQMVKEGLIKKKTAIMRLTAEDLNQLLLPSFDPAATRTVIARGLPASPGAASGKLAFSSEEVVERSNNGEAVILVRHETSADDIDGMHAARGILTATGGATSHAAVVARGWGKCCITGVAALQIDTARRRVIIDDISYGPDDVVSLDGNTGEVMTGAIALINPELSGDFATLMKWTDRYRTLGVRCNADTPADAERGRQLGAEGIGLCRTEHMFFDPQRIQSMREMILADDLESRQKALKKLLPYQRRDFEGLLMAMDGLPVTIRLLDPPLHEFLPTDKQDIVELAKSLGVSQTLIRQRISELHESNPMLGNRGCRLSICYPEILHMQVSAIVEATINCLRKQSQVKPQIMIPLTGFASELGYLKPLVLDCIAEVKKRKRFSDTLDIPVGTMIEVPRAALTAAEMAEHAEFFSFGTNDLTQMTLGFSRDDAGSFLSTYLHRNILPRDPFQSLDSVGVGQLIRLAVKQGRKSRKNLSCGICGEHGGDPDSIHFCHQVGLDYVSCSPFRVPIARLAAAQAALVKKK